MTGVLTCALPILVAQMPHGPAPFTVTELSEEMVTADFNHALAGKELTFSVEVIEIRTASESEAAHGHIHTPEQAKKEGESGGCNNDGCC